mmetsp:Transcript_10065/g.12708  ORF Transcript_10065/g.12708 Transcript_10065/m.12708 type:complete len:203 (+) Transcript_10065:45-653(+)
MSANSISNTSNDHFQPLAKKNMTRSILRAKSLDDSTDSSIHSTSSACTTSSSSSRSVSFDQVEIREYSITIGDNPSCSNGPPLSLGWTYSNDENHLPLDQYEQYRDGHRRPMHQMKVPARIRYDMLREWDVPTSVIANAQRECAEIQRQRSRTFDRVERSSNIKKFFLDGGWKLKLSGSKRGTTAAEKKMQRKNRNTYVDLA